MKFHLEISHRGSAKTWTLIDDILNNQKINPEFVAGIVSPVFKIICERLENRGGSSKNIIRIQNFSDYSIHANKLSKIYVDEFDFIKWITPEVAEEFVKINAFFVSTSSKIRSLEDFTPEKDTLAKLICLNDGYILNRISFNGQYFYKPFLQEVKELLKDKDGAFEKEYLSQFLK